MTFDVTALFGQVRQVSSVERRRKFCPNPRRSSFPCSCANPRNECPPSSHYGGAAGASDLDSAHGFDRRGASKILLAARLIGVARWVARRHQTTGFFL